MTSTVLERLSVAYNSKLTFVKSFAIAVFVHSPLIILFLMGWLDETYPGHGSTFVTIAFVYISAYFGGLFIWGRRRRAAKLLKETSTVATEEADPLPDPMIEDQGERQMFDQSAKMNGSPLLAIASYVQALQLQAPPMGSHGKYLAICYNELLKAEQNNRDVLWEHDSQF